jgi:hypothetical protein
LAIKALGLSNLPERRASSAITVRPATLFWALKRIQTEGAGPRTFVEATWGVPGVLTLAA